MRFDHCGIATQCRTTLKFRLIITDRPCNTSAPLIRVWREVDVIAAPCLLIRFAVYFSIVIIHFFPRFFPVFLPACIARFERSKSARLAGPALIMRVARWSCLRTISHIAAFI
jgi:hypothetical protein